MLYRYSIVYQFNCVHGGNCADSIDIVSNFEFTESDIGSIEQMIGAELMATGEWNHPLPTVVSCTLLGKTGDRSCQVPLAWNRAKPHQPWHERQGRGITTVPLHKPLESRPNPRQGCSLVALDGRLADKPKRHLRLVARDGELVDQKKPILRLIARDGKLVHQKPNLHLVATDGELVDPPRSSVRANRSEPPPASPSPPHLVAIDGELVHS